jgi:hypothetical protein
VGVGVGKSGKSGTISVLPSCPTSAVPSPIQSRPIYQDSQRPKNPSPHRPPPEKPTLCLSFPFLSISHLCSLSRPFLSFSFPAPSPQPRTWQAGRQAKVDELLHPHLHTHIQSLWVGNTDPKSRTFLCERLTARVGSHHHHHHHLEIQNIYICVNV